MLKVELGHSFVEPVGNFQVQFFNGGFFVSIMSVELGDVLDEHELVFLDELVIFVVML